MPYQAHRGNPELKQYFLVNNFVGGINTLSADDVISTVEAREVVNMHLSGSGTIEKRKGFSPATILNDWLSELSGQVIPEGNIFFIKVIKNEGNISKYIEEFELSTSPNKLQEFYNFIRTRGYDLHIILGYAEGEPDEIGQQTVKIDLIKLVNQDIGNVINGGSFETTSFVDIINDEVTGFDQAIVDTIDAAEVLLESEKENIITFDSIKPNKDPLTNIDIVSFLGKHYLLLPQLSPELSGILQIDEVEKDVYEYKIINNANQDNLYKPSPIDISSSNNLGGYNMLYDYPQSYLKNHTSIRNLYGGLYISESGTNKIYEDFSMPTSGNFVLNAIFSGSDIDEDSFELRFFTEDLLGNQTSIPFTLNSTNIDGALAQFDLSLDFTNLNAETVLVELKLVKDEDPIFPRYQFSSVNALQGYFVSVDYYITSNIDLTTKPISVPLRVRGEEAYNLVSKNAYVYRDNPILTLTATPEYYIDDNYHLFKCDESKQLNGSNATEYNNADYPVSFSYPGGGNPSQYAMDQMYPCKVRKDAVIRMFAVDDDGVPTGVQSFYTIHQNDTDLGSIYTADNYYIDFDNLEDPVVQVSSVENVIPLEGDIYLIDDQDNVNDPREYYKYNGGVTGTLQDFDYYTSEEETSFVETVEFPVQDSVSVSVEGIDFEGARILEIGDRLVAYKGNTIWFSDFRRFNYFPSNTYFNLSISSDDEITSINYFRGAYIVFTREMIFKMTGNLDVGDIQFQILNDSIGCIAPKSVKPFNNTLVFMSRDGLYRIKQNFYLDGLENVEKIDKRIPGVLQDYAIDYETMLHNEQYLLFTPSHPEYDVLRYYYNINLGGSQSPFVTDIYAQKPDHLFDIAGTMYAVRGGKIWQYDQGYTDFVEEDATDEETLAGVYRTKLTFPNFSFGYATHEKKFKTMFIKSMTDADMPLFLTVKIDGYDYASPYNFKVYRDGDGVIRYEYTLDVDTAALGSFLIGDNNLGESDTNQHKIAIGGKGKNLGLTIEQETNGYFAISNVGFLFKLGKVRGEL